MTHQLSILWRGLAVALLVGSGLVMAPAAPALARDDVSAQWEQSIFIPCRTDPHIPVKYNEGWSIDWEWTAKPQKATLVVYTTPERIRAHGKSELYHISTSGLGCYLEYDERENRGYVAVRAHRKVAAGDGEGGGNGR